MARISFGVYCMFRGYIPGAAALPAVAASPDILAGDF